MELQMVSTASIVGMLFSLIIAIGFPIALLIIGKKKFKAKVSSFFIGCGIFIVFALVLEQLLHALVLGTTGDAITGNIWLYALYGAAAAAVFEEVGRLLAMKFFLKKNLTLENAFMYGFGHGGCEAILILGVAEINNIANSIAINFGMMPSTMQLIDEEMQAELYGQLQALWLTPSIDFYLGGIERVFAIILQVAMSIVMFSGVRYGKKQFVALAFVMHFVFDFVTVVLAQYIPIWGVELVIAIMAIVAFLLSHKVVKGCEN